MNSTPLVCSPAWLSFRGALYFAGLLLLGSGLLHAQSPATGSVEGRVLNAVAGAYLGNARVVVEGTNLEALTNENGSYRLVGVPAGERALRVTFSGFGTQTLRVQVIAGQTVQGDFSILPLGRGAATDEVLSLAEFTVEERELSAQAAALQEQRNAPNIKNVIAFEEFGDLGEGNPGEFLKFVPGVQIELSPAVASAASIRGMPASGTLVLVDGAPVASNSALASGRQFDFTGADTGNIDRIEITKVPTPDMPANAVGGSINVIGKSGFSRQRPLLSYNIYGTLTTIESFRRLGSELGKRGGPDPDTRTSHVQPGLDVTYMLPVNRTLAFSFSVGKNARWEDKDLMNSTWDQVRGVQTSGLLNAAVALRKRSLASGRVDWKPNEKNSFRLTLQYSNDDVYSRQNVSGYNFGSGATGGETFTQGAANGVGQVTQSYTYRNQKKSTRHGALVYRFEGDVWKADASLVRSAAQRYTRSLEDGFFQNANINIPNLVLRGDGLDGIHSRTPTKLSAVDRSGQSVDVYDTSRFTLNTAGAFSEPTETDLTYAAANLGRSFDLRVPVAVKFGVAHDRTKRDGKSHTQSWNIRPPASAGGRVVGNYDLINTGYSRDRVFRDGLRVTWIDMQKLSQLYKTNPEYFQLNETSSHTSLVNGSKKLDETITAAYFRADAKFLDNRLWLVGGARFERTEDQGRGPLNDPSAIYQKDAAGNIIRDAAGQAIPITNDAVERARLQYQERKAYSKKSYDGFYPSLNSSYALTENLLVRAAYARTIGRPNLNFIIPGMTLTDLESTSDNRLINVINTGLEPWEANNYDLSFESYSFKGAEASVSLFRKEISNFFVTTRRPVTPADLAEFGLGDEYAEYDISTTLNSRDDATLSGLEWSWRQSLRAFGGVPRWARGVQLYVNGTHIRISGPGGNNFLNTTPRTINWGATFASRKLLLKVNVRGENVRRTALVAASATVPPGSYTAFASRMTVDVSFEYRFHKLFALYGSVRNLNNTPRRQIRLSPGAPEYAQPLQYAYYGALLTFGVKGVF